MTRYPRTIHNGGGERITFLGRTGQGETERLELENEVQPGHGPPMHLHPSQDEALTVYEGVLSYLVLGEEPRTVHAGESVMFKRGVPHRFWNSGNVPLRCGGWVSPPLEVEELLTALFESAARNGGTRPSAFDVAYIFHRWGAVGQMVGVPVPVKRILFPVLRVIGHLTGRYRRFREV
jgi:quercetin dioxygenase-like cupin family protein